MLEKFIKTTDKMGNITIKYGNKFLAVFFIIALIILIHEKLPVRAYILILGGIFQLFIAVKVYKYFRLKQDKKFK